MKLFQKTRLFFASIGMALLATACNSGGDDFDHTLFGDFVTLDQISANGSVSMSYEPLNYNQTVHLTANIHLDPETFKAGSRVFLNFYNDANDNTVSGPVEVLLMLNVTGAGEPLPQATAEDKDNWASNEVVPEFIYITGDYLNFLIQGYSTGIPQQCEYVVDSATLDEEYPTVQILFRGVGSNLAELYTDRASYNIAWLRQLATAKGLRIVYTGDTGAKKSVDLDFKKQSLTPAS